MPRHEVGEPELTIYGYVYCDRGVLHDCEHKHMHIHKTTVQEMNHSMYVVPILAEMMERWFRLLYLRFFKIYYTYVYVRVVN